MFFLLIYPLKILENFPFSVFKGYRSESLVENGLRKFGGSFRGLPKCLKGIWEKVFKNGPIKICGRQSSKTLK